ncbi:TIGR03032 family protein [Sinimarinibacterium flocculans]|uniref:TIGR03032 family protein n=1 Tax=Sinimarinibacterium flocculans TaxID=985250 RepID=UPI003516E19C
MTHGSRSQIDQPAAASGAEVLASEHTSNLPVLLDQLGISLLVTTYQAGKLIVVRPDGAALNTHFCQFPKPMGLAANSTCFSLGAGPQIVTYRNLPAVGRKLKAGRSVDACFLPRSSHITGDIDIHEMAFSQEGDLWFINTRFSCLCRLDGVSSFSPQWRPPFVSGLAPDDRCHLNGLAMRDGRPRYVTALGETDTGGGWRENRAAGGVLIDTEADEVLLRGLSMPHSPRWHDGRLWLLESGNGTLSVLDQGGGRPRRVAELPGFTRGLDFHGHLAFVGLSQVREAAVFSGIPITERVDDRICGIWVIDVNREQVIGFLRFKSGVQEVFGVSVLPGIRYPEVLPTDHGLVATAYGLPDEAMAEVLAPPRT